jgi:anaerobic magnesium-protoporphyrin IX monomethyl ester cyclase
MPYTPSLAPRLYVDAIQDVDTLYRELMREQDHSPVFTDPRKPRFTIVVGPSPFSMPRGWEFFLTAPYEGATYISTVLYNAGFPVKIVDVRYSPDPLRAAFEQIIDDTDVLGICTFEDNFPWVQRLMQLIKEERPKVPIICGGSLVTSVPHIFMEHTECDIAVISEGEITILELMHAYTKGSWRVNRNGVTHKSSKNLENIRGLFFRTTDSKGYPKGHRSTPPRGQMMDLDALPKMNLNLWPQANTERGLQPQIISSYSRGCKMDCSFCYRTTPQERAKSPEKLDAELVTLKEQHNIEFVFFVDLTFTSHKKQTMDILNVIKAHDIRWTCLTRCADVDKERAEAMQEAGCDIALFGVESLGKEVLREARKGNTENTTIKAQRIIEEAGVRFGGLTIVGLPNETEDSLDHMCTWAEENNHITRVKYLSLMPGTTVYQEGVDNGHIRSEIDHLNWLSIEQALYEDEFINVTEMSEAKMREGYQRIYDSYRPGPVMDFNHWPAYFSYHHPNTDSGQEHAQRYGGQNWRGQFSSAAPLLVPGSENFTLTKVGARGIAERGSSMVDCGAKRTEYSEDNFPMRYNGYLKAPKCDIPDGKSMRELFHEQFRENVKAELEEYQKANNIGAIIAK